MELHGPLAVVFAVGLAVVMVGMSTAPFLPERHLQRRTYWLSWLAGGGLITLAAELADPGRGWGIATMLAPMSVSVAYFKSPYLKIRGRIYAVSFLDRQPDPPRDGEPCAAEAPPPLPRDRYGHLSAATYWWLVATFNAGCATTVVGQGWTLGTSAAFAAFSACLAATGFSDAAGGYGIARRRFIPATVVTLCCVPMYFVPVAAYALGFVLGRAPMSDPGLADAPSEPHVDTARPSN